MLINPIYDSSVINAPAGFALAVQSAISFIDSHVSNNISMNITFTWGGAVGSVSLNNNSSIATFDSSPTFNNSFSLVGGWLASRLSATSATPSAAKVLDFVANTNFNTFSNGVPTDPTSGKGINLTGPQLYALSGATGALPDSAGTIGLNASYKYSFSQSSVATGTIDATGLLESSIMKLLGARLSEGNLYTNGAFSLLDLYGYSAPGSTNLANVQSQFSIDGGNNSLATLFAGTPISSGLHSVFTSASVNSPSYIDALSSSVYSAPDSLAGTPIYASDLDLTVLEALGYTVTGSAVPGIKALNADYKFFSSGANDQFQGMSGINTVTYAGRLSEYSLNNVSGDVSNITVKDSLPARDGTDTLNNIQKIKFSDYTVNTTMKAEVAKLAPDQVNSLIELYVAYFARTPDATGLSYWIDKAAAGESLTNISKEFYNAGIQFSSQTGYTAAMSNADFIKLVYANVLNRTGTTAPPSADVAYWDNKIQSGATTRDGLIQTILTAAHAYANDPIWGWVPQLLNNKIAVGYQSSVTDGLDYNSTADAFAKGMAVVQAVTPTDITAAVALIGVTANVHL